MIPINTGTLLRSREPFVYRAADETLHWVIGDVISARPASGARIGTRRRARNWGKPAQKIGPESNPEIARIGEIRDMMERRNLARAAPRKDRPIAQFQAPKDALCADPSVTTNREICTICLCCCNRWL